ncbi:MAG TPA: hypothetical protein VFB76_06750 [Candidatus Angelobacter sp.]|nr:hypothetical protein [Candidatus Angelobacter sp.]
MRLRLLLVTATLLASYGAGAADKSDKSNCPQPVSTLSMDRGEYSSIPGAVLGLQHFAARMVARGKTQPLCSARTTEIEHGEVFISAESLTKIFGQKIEHSNSKISDLQVEVKDNEVHLKGKVHKGIDIPFEVDGPVSTDGTNLKLEGKKVKAEHLPVKALMGMVGMHLSSLLQSEQQQGVTAQGNTLIFEPAKISHVQGRISAVRVTPKGIDISFVNSHPKQRAAR